MNLSKFNLLHSTLRYGSHAIFNLRSRANFEINLNVVAKLFIYNKRLVETRTTTQLTVLSTMSHNSLEWRFFEDFKIKSDYAVLFCDRRRSCVSLRNARLLQSCYEKFSDEFTGNCKSFQSFCNFLYLMR